MALRKVDRPRPAGGMLLRNDDTGTEVTIAITAAEYIEHIGHRVTPESPSKPILASRAAELGPGGNWRWRKAWLGSLDCETYMEDAEAVIGRDRQGFYWHAEKALHQIDGANDTLTITPDTPSHRIAAGVATRRGR